MVHQQALMILCPIQRGEEDAVKTRLIELDQRLRDNQPVILERLEGLHFARWVVLDAAEDRDGNPLPAELLFSANIDGDARAFIKQMIDTDPELIKSLYAHCRDFPDPQSINEDGLYDWLNRHTQDYAAFYIGSVGKRVDTIHREANLRDALEQHIDAEHAAGRLKDQSALAIRDALCSWVRTQKDLQWALLPEPGPSPADWAWHWGKLAAIVAAALFVVIRFFLTVVLLFIGWLSTVRVLERRDRQHPYDDDRQARMRHIRLVSREEDRITQNPMTSVTHIKTGFIRIVTLRFVLWAINLLARYLYVHGKLGSIPTIHFARWAIIDDARRLVFLSNYDGSWENYLGDFVDKAAVGLTGVWSNTIGFPDTVLLLFKGAKDEERFKAYTRRSQTLTQFWYSAYKNLTVDNITNNTRIREGLRGVMNEDQAQEWLLHL